MEKRSGIGAWLAENQRRKREQSRAILRALHTSAGMATLGAVLLVIAMIAFIDGRVEARQPENNVFVTMVEDGGVEITPEGYTPPSAVMEILREEEEQARKRETLGTMMTALCGAASIGYAAFLWTKKKSAAAKSADEGSAPAERAPMEEEKDAAIHRAVENEDADKREARRRNLEQLYKAGVLSKEEYRQRKERL